MKAEDRLADCEKLSTLRMIYIVKLEAAVRVFLAAWDDDGRKMVESMRCLLELFWSRAPKEKSAREMQKELNARIARLDSAVYEMERAVTGGIVRLQGTVDSARRALERSFKK